jgi:hypothetical protein
LLPRTSPASELPPLTKRSTHPSGCSNAHWSLEPDGVFLESTLARAQFMAPDRDILLCVTKEFQSIDITRQIPANTGTHSTKGLA